MTGVVQGVGFRYSTRDAALRLDVAGWVRNLPSGAVEVLAQGPAQLIDEMIGFLTDGPRYARVSAVQITEADTDPARAGFEILL